MEAHAHGHALLTKPSETAAKRWRFDPVESDSPFRTVRLTFSFRALEEELPEDQVTPIFRPPYRIEVMHNPNIIRY